MPGVARISIDVDLVLGAEDFLQERQGKDNRTVFDQRAAFHDPDHDEFRRFDLDRIADFFLEHFRRGPAQDDGFLGGIVAACVRRSA